MENKCINGIYFSYLIIKNEIDYNIPVVTKKKMKRKIFNGE